MTETTTSGLPLTSAASSASWYLKLLSALSNALRRWATVRETSISSGCQARKRGVIARSDAHVLWTTRLRRVITPTQKVTIGAAILRGPSKDSLLVLRHLSWEPNT